MTSAIMNPVRQFAKVLEAVEGGLGFAEASAAASQATSGRRGGRRARG